jgi:hypothetical protein
VARDPGRRAVRSRVRQIWGSLRQVAVFPRKLVLLATGSFARQLLLAMTLSVALGAFGDHQWPLVLIVIITLVNLSGANLAGEIAGLVSGQPSFTAVPEALTISMLLPTDS